MFGSQILRCAWAIRGPRDAAAGVGQPFGVGRLKVGFPLYLGSFAAPSQREPKDSADIMSYGSPYTGLNTNGAVPAQSAPLPSTPNECPSPSA